MVDVDPRRGVILPPLEGTRSDRLAAGERPLRLDRGRVGLAVGRTLERPGLEGEIVEPLREPAKFVAWQPGLPIGGEVVGRQQIDKRPHVRVDPLPGREVGRADRLHLHRLLDAVVAGGQQLPLPLHAATFHLGDLDAADATDSHRLQMLLMAEHRNRVAVGIVGVGLGGGVVDRGGAGNRPALGIADDFALRIGQWNGLGHRHLAAVHLDRDLLLEVSGGDLVHPDELAVDVAGEQPVFFGKHDMVLKAVVQRRSRAVRGCSAHVMPFAGAASCRQGRGPVPTPAAWPPPFPGHRCSSFPSRVSVR